MFSSLPKLAVPLRRQLPGSCQKSTCAPQMSLAGAPTAESPQPISDYRPPPTANCRPPSRFGEQRGEFHAKPREEGAFEPVLEPEQLMQSFTRPAFHVVARLYRPQFMNASLCVDEPLGKPIVVWAAGQHLDTEFRYAVNWSLLVDGDAGKQDEEIGLQNTPGAEANVQGSLTDRDWPRLGVSPMP
jgi:hypothetical protein